MDLFGIGAPDALGTHSGNQPSNSAPHGRELCWRRLVNAVGQLGELRVGE
jgi:hypothetical protein